MHRSQSLSFQRYGAVVKKAEAIEESPLGRKILGQLQENLRIAEEERIPICQDTGMAVVFAEIGQEVHFEGGLLDDAIHEGCAADIKKDF